MKMKLIVVFTAVLLTGNASAAGTQTQSAAMLTEVDMQAAFKQDSTPMELASLSGQEMKETEGTFLPFMYYAGMYGPGIYSWAMYSGMAYSMPTWVNYFRNEMWPKYGL